MIVQENAQISQGSKSLPWLTASGVAIATLLWLVFGAAPESLVFDRDAIAAGEIWRLVTGHWVHSDAGHALWDIGALAIIGWLLEPQGRWRMIAVALAGMLAVDVCLWWFMPALDRYCGLSGLLNAMFIVAIVDLWRAYRHPVYVLAGLIWSVKLAREATLGISLVVSTAWPTVPQSHLAGGLGGIALLLVGYVIGRSEVRTNPGIIGPD